MPQSNRRPGGGAGKLRPTLDSERSPSVHYANWKETMLLERQLSTLSRTEKSLVHGITVDQKVRMISILEAVPIFFCIIIIILCLS